MAKEQWGTRIGVILAVAGSAVGLGNFLRFPGNAAENGGGAFMIPYFISLLVIGVPLCWAEWTMGRYAGVRGCNSAPSIFTAIWPSRWAKYVGAPALMIPLVVYMYYVLIEAWCLGYAIQYLTGDLMQTDPDYSYGAHLTNYIGGNEDAEVLKNIDQHWPFLAILVCTFTLNFALIYRGVTKGIETFCRFAMPCMIVLAIIVLIRVLTLSPPEDAPDQTVVAGLGFMWNPNWDLLWSSKTWLAASGQIFFSLSVGFGIIINYASYLRRNDDVVLSGLTASSMNEFFEVCLGGLITIPAAFVFMGMAAGDSTGSTFSLGFIALPNVFAQMPGGQFFGFLWFFMLFIAAMTSSVSMLQPVIAFLEEGFGLKRHASAAILGLLSAIGTGVVMVFSKDTVGLDTFDFWIGTFLIFILALIQSLMYGWVLGIKRGEEEAHKGAHLRIPRVVQYMLKYIVPVYLLFIFGFFCYEKLPSADERLFDLDAQVGMSLDTGEIPVNVSAGLEENQKIAVAEASDKEREAVAAKYVLPDGAMVSGKESRWKIKDEKGVSQFVLVLNPDERRIDVYKHSAGAVETVFSKTGSIVSILFITGLFIFMVGMIHIAGRRWKAEGKFDKAQAA